jgi:hypothetical protein
MSYGQVIKMHEYVYPRLNSGTLRDLETDTEYTFVRGAVTTGRVPAWNVKLYDIVTFTIDGSTATDVTLYKKFRSGLVYSFIPS